MKKILAVLLPIFILMGLTGCVYKKYSGDNPTLYTVAINSVIWNNGHSFSADRYVNSEIKVVDEDAYGRIMFVYYEKYYAGAGISFSALVICQSATEKYAFYYEDVNYIIKEQELYTQNITDFTNDEIEQLKEVNDWGKELNFEKCIKKGITREKPKIPYENEVETKIVNEFNLGNKSYSLFINFLTNNSANSSCILYGYIKLNNENDIYFISLVEYSNSIEKIYFLIPSNVYDYKTEFVEFKNIHNWN